jgi:hypothetical protein
LKKKSEVKDKDKDQDQDKHIKRRPTKMLSKSINEKISELNAL